MLRNARRLGFFIYTMKKTWLLLLAFVLLIPYSFSAIVANVYTPQAPFLEVDPLSIHKDAINATQFEYDTALHIRTSWLTSFIESISKWTNYYNKTEVDDLIDAIPSPDLTPYALLNGSNQPFTGDINISDSRLYLTQNDTYSYWEKDTVNNELRLVNYAVTQGGLTNGLRRQAGTNTAIWGSGNMLPEQNASVALWFNYDATPPGTRGIIARGTYNDFGIGFGGSKFTVRLQSINEFISHTMTPGNWYHLVFTFEYIGVNQQRVKVYQNGNLIANVVHIRNILNSSVHQFSLEPSGINNVARVYDEVIITSGVLTDAEVAAMYNLGAGREETPSSLPNIVSIHHLNEMSGFTAEDSSGNGFDMALTGTGWQWVTGRVPSGGTLQEQTLLRLKDGADALSSGTVVLGNTFANIDMEYGEQIRVFRENELKAKLDDGFGIVGEFLMSDKSFDQSPTGVQGRFVNYYSSEPSRVLLFNQYERTVANSGETILDGMRNELSKTKADDQTGTFTGYTIRGVTNDITFSGTHTNNPTVSDRVNIYGMENTILDSSVWNRAGKTRNIDIAGIRSFLRLNSAGVTAGALTRTLTGVQVEIETISGTNTITNMYGLHIKQLFANNNSNVTGNQYGIYVEPNVDNVIRGQLTIGANVKPTTTLDVYGDINASTIYYDALIAKSPHAFAGDTRFCRLATNGKVVVETIEYINGEYKNIIVEDTEGICNKLSLAKIEERDVGLHTISGEPVLVKENVHILKNIWTGELSEQIESYYKELPYFETGYQYETGEVFVYEGFAYEVIQPHTSQSNWIPSELPALYKVLVLHEYNEVSEWVQPLGAHDCYPLGAIVTYNGQTYESQHNCNVWQPPTLWGLI